ncbi:(Fe-S)-binding protein [Candidatus Desulforudis audaxviator]|nr:(Fe-S)-binding protein [Candidatus Desulforudis audaxviator]AZK58661.1 Fe-S oxidoreductase [Candidatus Desulforudis audaxviator]
MFIMEAKKLSEVRDPNFRDEISQKMCFHTEEGKFDLNYCLACGTCAAACYFTDLVENHDPRKFMRKVALGLKDEVLNDRFVWLCNMCGRCTMHCPGKVPLPAVVRTVRGQFGLTAPGRLQEVADLHMRVGNQMEITEEEFMETIEWMQEELQEEFGDSSLTIPVNVEGAEILFLPHPREIKYYPEDIKSWTKIFWNAKESWTLSSKAFDVTNFGLFNGRDDEAKKIMDFVVDEMRRLGVKRCVMTECGHGYWAFVWGKKVWYKEGEVPWEFEHMVGWMANLIKTGKIKVDKTKNPYVVTIHDPCNTVRKGGLIEEGRYILENVAEKFVDMWPNREYNYCCGGGAGALPMGTVVKKERMAKGKLKADQMMATGAEICCAPCHNCYDQLNDINKEYNLGMKIKHLHHLVEHALIWPEDGPRPKQEEEE